MKHGLKRMSMALCMAMLTSGLSPVTAQTGVFAYPEQGQSEQQQQQDHFECHEWSVNRTGFNPNRAPRGGSSYAHGSPPPSQSGYFGRGNVGDGGMLGDAAGGAALGAIGGAIAGDAGGGAAIGALAGTLFGGIRRSDRRHQEEQWRRQQQVDAQRRHQQAEAEFARGMDLYHQAYSACMSARGYSVR